MVNWKEIRFLAKHITSCAHSIASLLVPRAATDVSNWMEREARGDYQSGLSFLREAFVGVSLSACNLYVIMF